MDQIAVFRIKSKKANKYITVQADVMEPKLVLHDLNSKLSQNFGLSVSGSAVELVELSGKKKMIVSQESDQNGAPLILSQAKQQSKSHKFQLHSTAPGSDTIAIFTFCGKCLDCCEESVKNGTEIIQWEFHGSDNQKWILQRV